MIYLLLTLAAKCISCHGPEKQEGGLRMNSDDLYFQHHGR